PVRSWVFESKRAWMAVGEDVEQLRPTHFFLRARRGTAIKAELMLRLDEDEQRWLILCARRKVKGE
ncbi:hypothetical protein ACFKP0_25315, partial [Salmonella enterica subsp. enterica serovar Soahanina]